MGAEVSVILAILDKALQYGIPIVKQQIENSGKTVITEEDVKNLIIDDNPNEWFSQ